MNPVMNRVCLQLYVRLSRVMRYQWRIQGGVQGGPRRGNGVRTVELPTFQAAR